MTSSNLIGAAIPRAEDNRLLRGAGCYSDDQTRDEVAYAIMVRSDIAHALLVGLNCEAAKTSPGVLAVLTGEDWRGDGLHPMPAWGNPKDVELKNRDGTDIFYTPLWPIAFDRVRRVGEIVAVVVGETEAKARDAAELISLKLKNLKASANPFSNLLDQSDDLWDEIPENLNVDDLKGDVQLTKQLFAKAAHVVKLETINQRVTGVPMEPRAALAEYSEDDGSFLLEAGGQGVIRFQNELSTTLGVDKSQVRVISRDVGGGYGTRNHTYPEFPLVMWAAKRVGRPVKWVSSRTEGFLSDYAGRDLKTVASIAMNEDGRVLAMRSQNIGNIGTHTVSYVPIARGPTVYNGVYDIPVATIETQAIVSNTTVSASYRGAGRPESMFVIERLMDLAAEKIGIDRIEIRRRNLINPAAIPYKNGVGVTYDSGDFGLSMDLALEKSDWGGFENRKIEAESRGMLRGIGLANYIETATGYPQERAEMRIKPDGVVELVIGTQSSGQGHETSYAQVVAEWLNIPFESIYLRTGDTDFVTAGSGSHSSRSMRLAAHLFKKTTDIIIEKGKLIASHILEAASDDIEFTTDHFVLSGTDRRVGLFEVASAAENNKSLPTQLSGPLKANAEILVPLPAYPNGCHVAEVEVDPETGIIRLVRYTGIDDVGRVINPMIVDGQTHGGIVQGLGQALMEECVYDHEGQLQSGSFMDYAIPRAEGIPEFKLGFNEVIAASTFLGVKGGGEGGTTAAPPAIVNAVCHALTKFGVSHLDMPLTSEKIWKEIQKG